MQDVITKKRIEFENNIKYNVETLKYKYKTDNIFVEIWKNNNKIDRLYKPAFTIKNEDKIITSICFKNGKIHGYNDEPAVYHQTLLIFLNPPIHASPIHASTYKINTSFSRDEFNYFLHFKDGKLNRNEKPAFFVEQNINKTRMKTLEAYFKNGKTFYRENGSICSCSNANDELTSKEIIFSHNNKLCNGYNFFHYSNGIIRNKSRLKLDLNEKILFFQKNIDHIFKTKNKTKWGHLLSDVIRNLSSDVFLSEQTEKFFSDDEYYGLPSEITFNTKYKIKQLSWLKNNNLHREDKPAVIEFNTNSTEYKHYINGEPKEEINEPFSVTKNNNGDVIEFRFKNEKLRNYYKKYKINPYNLTESEMELLELNFLA